MSKIFIPDGATALARRTQLTYNAIKRDSIRLSADVPKYQRSLRQLNTSNRQKKMRNACLDVTRDGLACVENVEEVICDVAVGEILEPLLIDGPGEVGGVVCPVCWRNWYGLHANGVICEDCQIPLPYKDTLENLRRSINNIVTEHCMNCRANPSFSHVPDSCGFNLLCVCDACGYLNIVV